jgi:hypothetical protein
MAKTIVCSFPLDDHTLPTEVDAGGFHGKGCKAVTQAFATALGATVSTTDKPEMFQNSGGNVLVNR